MIFQINNSLWDKKLHQFRWLWCTEQTYQTYVSQKMGCFTSIGVIICPVPVKKPWMTWVNLTDTLPQLKKQVKRRQSQSYKFKKFAKISNFWIFKRALHVTHLLKLLDKMCKYEIDPMSIVEDTERTRFWWGGVGWGWGGWGGGGGGGGYNKYKHELCT